MRSLAIASISIVAIGLTLSPDPASAQGAQQQQQQPQQQTQPGQAAPPAQQRPQRALPSPRRPAAQPDAGQTPAQPVPRRPLNPAWVLRLSRKPRARPKARPRRGHRAASAPHRPPRRSTGPAPVATQQTPSDHTRPPAAPQTDGIPIEMVDCTPANSDTFAARLQPRHRDPPGAARRAGARLHEPRRR